MSELFQSLEDRGRQSRQGGNNRWFLKSQLKKAYQHGERDRVMSDTASSEIRTEKLDTGFSLVILTKQVL